jgi:hypothetical protein
VTGIRVSGRRVERFGSFHRRPVNSTDFQPVNYTLATSRQTGKKVSPTRPAMPVQDLQIPRFAMNQFGWSRRRYTEARNARVSDVVGSPVQGVGLCDKSQSWITLQRQVVTPLIAIAEMSVGATSRRSRLSQIF